MAADPGPFLNRELSWLAFDRRVLEEAQEAEQPRGLSFRPNGTKVPLTHPDLLAISGSICGGSFGHGKERVGSIPPDLPAGGCLAFLDAVPDLGYALHSSETEFLIPNRGV
jgi:Polyphosphate kinase N-terminal domain